MPSQNILSARNICFSYDGSSKALKNVMLDVPRGKKTVFLGPNGSGKSTLFLHFNGILKPDSGKILFDGKRLGYDQSSLVRLRENIAVVFQNPDDQIFSANVEEDIAFGPLNLCLPKEEVDARVDEALSLVGLTKLRKRPTQQLSFGQRKRVALAGALAMKPKVLIMDEPTAGLDTEMVHELLELADELNHLGITIIMSTHDVETAYEWADEVRVISDGKILFAGKPELLFTQSELLHKLGIIPPIAFLLNEQMNKSNGEPIKPYPKSFLELSHKLFAHKKAKDGCFNVICVNKLDNSLEPNVIARMLKINLKEIHKISGVYGTLARRLLNEGKLDVHYRFHALEHGLFQASIGEEFILFTDSSLCTLVETKIKKLERTNGMSIKIRHLHTK